MGAKLSPGQPLIVGNPIRTLACPLARLSRIHAKANPRAGKQLSDPAPLVVGKRIHRIHDHGLDHIGLGRPQAVVNDRHQERFGLARPRSGGDHSRLAFEDPADRCRLVSVGRLGNSSETLPGFRQQFGKRRAIGVGQRERDEGFPGEEALPFDGRAEVALETLLAWRKRRGEKLQVIAAKLLGNVERIHDRRLRRLSSPQHWWRVRWVPFRFTVTYCQLFPAHSRKYQVIRAEKSSTARSSSFSIPSAPKTRTRGPCRISFLLSWGRMLLSRVRRIAFFEAAICHTSRSEMPGFSLAIQYTLQP